MDDNIIGWFLNKCGQIRYTFMIMVNSDSNHSNLSRAVSSAYDDYTFGVSLFPFFILTYELKSKVDDFGSKWTTKLSTVYVYTSTLFFNLQIILEYKEVFPRRIWVRVWVSII